MYVMISSVSNPSVSFIYGEPKRFYIYFFITVRTNLIGTLDSLRR